MMSKKNKVAFISKIVTYFSGLVFLGMLHGCGGGGDGTSTGAAPILSWETPAHRENGALLGEISGYRIYYGSQAGNHPNQIDISDVSLTQIQLTGIPAGTYFVVMTVLDLQGHESMLSPELIVAI